MLDIHALIDFCCGVKDPKEHAYTEKQEILAKQFVHHGFDGIRPSSIQKWIERGQVPGDRLVELHLIAKKQGKKLDLYRFIVNSKAVEGVFG